MLQRTNATTKECYNERMLPQAILSIKSGYYNEHGCYNERGEILSIMGSTITVFTVERFIILFMCVRLFMLLIKESSH